MTGAGEEPDWGEFFRDISAAGFVPRHWTANEFATMTFDQLWGMVVPNKKTTRIVVSPDAASMKTVEDAWLRDNAPEAKRAKALRILDREMRRQGL